MKKLLTFILMSCIGFLSPSAAGQDGFDVTVRGVVRDEVSRRPVAFVNVFLPGENIGTVTNGEGAFSLKIKSSNLEKVLEFSCMGYAGSRISLQDFDSEKNQTVWLKPVYCTCSIARPSQRAAAMWRFPRAFWMSIKAHMSGEPVLKAFFG